MDRHLRRLLEESGYGEPGLAAFYDRFRPRPPQALLELLPWAFVWPDAALYSAVQREAW
jgi:hypothetical protein